MPQKGVESLPSNTLKVPHGPVIREIFSHKPAWWARWTWPLLFGITVWSAVAARTAFYHWTHRVERIDEPVSAEQDASENADPEASKKISWELRPLNHRAMMSGGILASGTALGIVFLSTRSRIVRRLSLVSHTTPFKHGFQRRNPGKDLGQPEDFPYVLVESVVNTSGRGSVFLKEGCELSPGRDDTEMWLKVPGGRKFWVGMKGSVIEGAPVPQGAVRKLLEIWNGDAQHGNSRGRWLRGPIVGRHR